MTRLCNAPLLLVLTAAAAFSPLSAQTHKVETPDSVVRAVGVYEWTGDLARPTASRLVPVTLYINGRFEEAGVYLARPVPFVLDTGFAYELDEAGRARGMFDMLSAARLNGGADTYDNPWIGVGKVIPPAPEAKAAPLRTIKNPTISSSKTLGADDNSDRPHLVNKSPDAKTGDPSTSATTPRPRPDPSTVGTGATPPSSSTSDSKTDSKNDVDRPTLRRAPPPTKEEQKKAEADRKKASQSSVSGPDKPLNDDPDRPTLRRKSAGGEPDGPAELLGLPADMRQLTAVSDAATRPDHNFARPWEDDNEHTAILRRIQAMAREQLANYDKLNPLPANADTTTVAHDGPVSTPTPSTVVTPDGGPPKLQRGIPKSQSATTTPVTAAPATAQMSTTSVTPPTTKASTAVTTTKPAAPMTPAARRRAAAAAAAAAKAVAAAPPPPPTPLLDENLHGYELSYGADPAFVYTAHTPGTGAAERFITLVAQQDPISHDLRLALHSVTDAAHRDRTPEMRPVDAVDADASNRASLLVELRNQNSRQFALYRIITGRAEQIFLTGTTQ